MTTTTNQDALKRQLRKKLGQRKALIRKQADIIESDEIETGAVTYLQREYREIDKSLTDLEAEIERIEERLK